MPGLYDPMENEPPDSMGEGAAALAGCVAGLLSGPPLGVIIALLIGADWPTSTLIIVFHITVAMVAMCAWAAPSLVSKPDSLETDVPRHPVSPVASSLEKAPVRVDAGVGEHMLS